MTEIVLLPIAEEDEMVSRLLQFRAFVDTIVVSSFREGGEIRDDSKVKSEKNGKAIIQAKTRGPFSYAASDAFARGFSKRPRKPAEMIGLFFNNHAVTLTTDILISQIYRQTHAAWSKRCFGS